MDYNIFYKIIKRGLTTSLIFFSFYGCNEEGKVNIDNTYYVELINFNDSLKDFVSANINGKVSFHKNNKLEIVSLNYVTENYPDMHYFKDTSEISKPVKPGLRKIRIEFLGNYTVDSIKYLVQKYKYEKEGWKKVSDMGFSKGFSIYKNLREYALREYGNQIINTTVTYTYD